MCGVIGFAGPPSLQAALLFQSLLIADEVRGKHSTGYVVLNGQSPVLVKKALSGQKFVEDGFTQPLFKRRFRLALGHNRQATCGAVNHRNAHPFGMKSSRGGWCYGVHNGIVRNATALARSHGVVESPVDSETVLRAIVRGAGTSERELVESIEGITREIRPHADFAFLYLDPGKKGIYFWRSPERPLVVLDARKVGLGRWFCSTVEIFVRAWKPLRGFLPSISKASVFDAKAFTLYRVRDDGHFEVEPIRRLDVGPEPAAPLYSVDGCLPFTEKGGEPWS